jgi:hypothetical protein
MIWLGILIGTILGIGSTFLYFVSLESNKSQFIKRGIWSNHYTCDGKSFDVQFELGELEKTSIRSKVKVISMVASQSKFNDDEIRKKISEMVDNTWMLSSKVEWIEDDLSTKRNNKIEEILK